MQCLIPGDEALHLALLQFRIRTSHWLMEAKKPALLLALMHFKSRTRHPIGRLQQCSVHNDLHPASQHHTSHSKYAARRSSSRKQQQQQNTGSRGTPSRGHGTAVPRQFYNSHLGRLLVLTYSFELQFWKPIGWSNTCRWLFLEEWC